MSIGHSLVKLGNTDVEGIVVFVAPPASIRGRLRIEGEIVKELPSLNAIAVYLEPLIDGMLVMRPTPAQSRPIAPDGSFVIDGLSSGEFQLRVRGSQVQLPLTVYVKEARIGETDVLNKPVRFPVAQDAVLEIVLGVSSSRVEGDVTNSQSQPVPETQVVLVPDQNRSRADLYRMTASDRSGHFAFENIPPGDYKVFAWERIEPWAVLDPDVLKRFETRGEAVHVLESSNSTIAVKVIPAEQ